MSDDELRDGGRAAGREDERPDERVLDPANLDAERQVLGQRFVTLLEGGLEEEVRTLAAELSPGDLSEILRPLDVADTARILRLLPPDPVSEVLLEIDNRSLNALLTLLDVDAIAGGPGRAEDASLKLARDVGERVQAAVGYRLVEGAADVDAVYTFAWLHYAVGAVRVAF